MAADTGRGPGPNADAARRPRRGARTARPQRAAPRRPLLFLDVDGPLNPWRAPGDGPPGYTEHRMRPSGWEQPREALPVRLNPAHGPLLLALGYHLVWATTWAAQANTWIAPVLGLPPLPHVDWPAGGPVHHGEVHWKTRSLVRYADQRPFAWVDDEVTTADRTWVARHHAGPALLHTVDPAIGLTAADFDHLAGWAAAAGGSGCG